MSASNYLFETRLTTLFQPIVELNHGRTIGYEALTRGPHGTGWESPRALFAEAARTRSVLQLEEHCWRTALESMARQQSQWAPSARIFVNALPATLLTRGFERVVSELAAALHLDPAQIVIEISEATRIEDFASFRAAISSYRMSGFGVAVDDAGAGHSGLQMVAEIVPDLIKIDAGLIRGVDTHLGRQATIEALLMLARSLGIDVIAEGIEREEELVALRALGVQIGQGYLLGRPSEVVRESIEPDVVPGLQRTSEHHGSRVLDADSIGRLGVSAVTVPTGVDLSVAVTLFEQQHVDGIVVLQESAPVGIVMRSHVYHLLGGRYGRELYLRRPVDLGAHRPLVVDYGAPLEEVSRLAMARNSHSLYDHIVLTRDAELFGVVSVQRLLAAITDARVNAARNANPLTGLPGNAMIERELRSRIRESERVALIHIDLDDFKAFNDRHGFHRGDVVITMTAQLIARELDAVAGKHFLGHIGGDDFVTIVHADNATTFVDRLQAEFEVRIASVYGAEDPKREFDRTADGTGERESFPSMTLSVAMAFVEPNDNRHYAQLLDALSAAKREAKARKRGRRQGIADAVA